MTIKMSEIDYVMIPVSRPTKEAFDSLFPKGVTYDLAIKRLLSVYVRDYIKENAEQ